MISVRDLTVRFGNRTVLDSINLEIAKNEIVVVMGSSGGGKSTLLRCISGLLRPTSGDVIVDGVSVTDQPDQVRKKLGMVFQSAALFDYLTVSENILFGAKRQRHLNRKAQTELVEKLLDQVSLERAGALMPDELSGGMKKRVSLARALAMEPQVLLYDEPTSGLDPVTAYSIDQLIVETRNRFDATSVVVSHDVNSILRVADRIAFLDQGRLSFVGSVDEFKANKQEEIAELVEKAQAQELFTPN